MCSTCPHASVSLFSPPPGDTSLPSQNCGNFPFYGRPLRNSYASCCPSPAHSPRFMSCAEYSIVKTRAGCVSSSLTSRNSQACLHERPRHRLDVPYRPLDHCDALTLADSTILELHLDRTKTSAQSPDDFVLQRYVGPLAVRNVDELFETAEGDVSCRSRGCPLIGPVVLNAVTRQPIWVCGICTRGSTRHLSSCNLRPLHP